MIRVGASRWLVRDTEMFGVETRFIASGFRCLRRNDGGFRLVSKVEV